MRCPTVRLRRGILRWCARCCLLSLGMWDCVLCHTAQSCAFESHDPGQKRRPTGSDFAPSSSLGVALELLPVTAAGALGRIRTRTSPNKCASLA